MDQKDNLNRHSLHMKIYINVQIDNSCIFFDDYLEYFSLK